MTDQIEQGGARDKNASRALWAVTLLLGSALLAPVAVADLAVVNDLATGGDAFKTRGSTGTAQVYLIASDNTPTGDRNGCNAGSGTPVTVTLTSSDTSRLTLASPGSVSLTDCGRDAARTLAYSIPAGAPEGRVVVTATATGGKVNSAYTSDVFNVTVDATPPAWPAGSQLRATVMGETRIDLSWDAATDANGVRNYRVIRDGAIVATVPGTQTAYSATGLSSGTRYEFKIEAGDAAGHWTTNGPSRAATTTAPAPADSTPPIITSSLAPASPDGLNGWYRSSVSVAWTVSDPESSFTATGCGPATLSADTTGTTYTCSATSAGGTSSSSVTLKRDAAAPANISFVGGPAAGATYDYGSVPAAPSCSAEDATSGVASCAVAGHSSAIGTHTIRATATDHAGNSASVERSYTVVDPSPPEIRYTLDPSAPDGDDGWYRTNVTVSWSVRDNESAFTATGCGPATLSADSAGQTFTCSATSAGGTANESVTLKRDSAAPTSIAFVGGPEAGARYAVGEVPAAPSCSAEDATSGVASCAVTGYGTAIGTHTLTATATDRAGNSASANRSYEVYDATAPNVGYTLAPGSPDGDNGWYKSNVSVSWQWSDAESTVSSTSGCVDTTLAADTAGVTLSCSATSLGGTSSDSVTLKRDATPPRVALVDGPASGATYYHGGIPNAPTCAAEDATSGVASCVVSGYSTAVGIHTVTARATDHAGNVASESRTYEVKPLTVDGFYSPVAYGGSPGVSSNVVNTVKAGAAVPLKFTVWAGPTKLTDTTLVRLSTAKVSCVSGASADSVDYTVSTGSTTLRYDATAGHFVYNWATPKAAGSCYRVTASAADGTSVSALFQLK